MTVDDPHHTAKGTSSLDTVKSEAVDQASRLADNVKSEASRREKDLRAGIADRAESVADGLRKAKSDLDPDSPIATMFDRAADSVSGLAGSLNSTDPAQMLHDVRSFARRQPGAFLGLSALAGFAAARFLRAGSSHSDDHDRSGGYGGYGGSGTTPRQTSEYRAPVSPAGVASAARPSTSGIGNAPRPGTPVPAVPTSPVAGTRPAGRTDGGSNV